MRKYLYISLLFLCVSSMCYANRTESECDSIRSFLVSIGETEPYISQVIKHTDIPYGTIVYFYEVGFSYNETDGKGYWALEPSRVHLGKEYYIHRIVSDTVLYNLHILFNRFISTQNNDSLIYCFQYATEKFHDPFAAIYHRMLRKLDFRHEHTTESECMYLYSVMEDVVLCGEFDNVINKSISLIPYDSLLHAEMALDRRNLRRNVKKETYYARYMAKLREIYINRSLAYISDEDKQELEYLLTEGLSHNEHSCAVLLAFAKITGMILDKNVSEGMHILSSIWPDADLSPVWECLGLPTR